MNSIDLRVDGIHVPTWLEPRVQPLWPVTFLLNSHWRRSLGEGVGRVAGAGNEETTSIAVLGLYLVPLGFHAELRLCAFFVFRRCCDIRRNISVDVSPYIYLSAWAGGSEEGQYLTYHLESHSIRHPLVRSGEPTPVTSG